MLKAIVHGSLADSNAKQQALLEYFRALGSGIQKDILNTVLVHRKSLEGMIQGDRFRQVNFGC